jgi:hypothetical protein
MYILRCAKVNAHAKGIPGGKPTAAKYKYVPFLCPAASTSAGISFEGIFLPLKPRDLPVFGKLAGLG